jgi:hypothetical protein
MKTEPELRVELVKLTDLQADIREASDKQLAESDPITLQGIQDVAFKLIDVSQKIHMINWFLGEIKEPPHEW